MAATAQAYDELSKPEFETGSQFIRELNLSQGDKVLDMGCGTGILTKYIADIVGPNGQVVGIDPDAARIKIAQQKYKEISNLQFHVGDSVTGFPHDNELYYDVHISTFVFHWVPNDEKKIYIQRAHQCLKSGGKLVIFCVEKMFDNQPYYYLLLDGYRKLFQDIGLFTEGVQFKQIVCQTLFKSLEEFKCWFKASCYYDILPDFFTKGYVTVSEDDGVSFKTPFVSMIGSKRYPGQKVTEKTVDM